MSYKVTGITNYRDMDRIRWEDFTNKLNEREETVNNYKPIFGERASLKDSQPELYEKHKGVIEEFEERASNSFSQLCAVSNNRTIGRSLLDSYYDSVTKSNLFRIISNDNALLFFELEHIFYKQYKRAIEKIGQGYRDNRFL